MDTKVGIVGAGYIASWHAEALDMVPGVTLAGVADVNLGAAEALAGAHGVPAYGSLAEMAASGGVDAVHILTQPHLHKPLAIEALEAGLDVLVEKPFATSAAEAREIVDVAETCGRQVGVGHNFLGLGSYARLKRMVEAGTLGRVSSAEIHWHLPLAPLRSGPYGLWLLRETRNLLLELGPHLFAFARDLFGPLEVLAVETAHPVDLPGGWARGRKAGGCWPGPGGSRSRFFCPPSR